MLAIRAFILFAASLCLTACGSLAMSSVSAQPEERDYDSRYSIWVKGAKGTVWARLRTFSPDSVLVQSLEAKCRSGVPVEVLVWAGAEASVATMKGSCLRIWLTNHPDVARLPDTLLVDADTLVVYGNLEDFQGPRARNEYRMQALVKQKQAYRVN
jgi:hypothetical protein